MEENKNIHRNINYKKLNGNTETIESIEIQIAGKIVICAYQPPLTPINENDLNNINISDRVIAARDYNAPNTAWGCRSDNAAGIKVEKHAEKNGLAIYHSEKYTNIPQAQNQYPSIIDIVITKNQGILNIEVEHTTSSDHKLHVIFVVVSSSLK